MAFLEEEQDDVVVADDSQRPRRRVGGPQRRRQQFLVRRLIGVGVGLAFLILIVVGIRGCLEARSHRALRNYASDVASIMQQSQQSGKDFFDLFNTGSSSDPLQVKQQILAQRDAAQALLDRAQKLDTPGEMHDAENAVELTLNLRRNGLDTIASNVQQAAARTQTANALSKISNAMGSLYASDIVWTQVGSPEIKKVLDDQNVDAPPLPAGTFMPSNATDFLSQTTLVTKLNSITGSAPTTGGVHGLQLNSTSIGGTQLSASSTTTVPSSSQEIDINVTNSGDSDETGINVDVTVGGSTLTGQLQSLSAGQAGTVKIPLTSKPTPGTQTTVEVVVQPVPGEQLTDNNQATYTVVFGS